ncbi:MAG TPA: DinB family protein, partial [Rhodothermales bacterium]|nr:DinB family protein [Rhodothermales bacterium]
MLPGRLVADDHAPYFERYTSLVTEDDLIDLLRRQGEAVPDALGTLDDAQAGHRYAPEKWTVREVIGHLTDTERVFGYRALALARDPGADLPSFDENVYAAHAPHDRVPIAALAEEFAALRRSHIYLFEALDAAAWNHAGRVSGGPGTPRGMAYILV